MPKKQDEAIAELKELLKPGDTVYCILRHVSRSGMMRAISPVLIRNGDAPWDIDYLVAWALGRKFNEDHGGVTCHGCGMDMGLDLVYTLSQRLFPDGFECIGESEERGICPSNDHVNGDRDYTPHHHNSGGFALRHRWL